MVFFLCAGNTWLGCNIRNKTIVRVVLRLKISIFIGNSFVRGIVNDVKIKWAFFNSSSGIPIFSSNCCYRITHYLFWDEVLKKNSEQIICLNNLILSISIIIKRRLRNCSFIYNFIFYFLSHLIKYITGVKHHNYKIYSKITIYNVKLKFRIFNLILFKWIKENNEIIVNNEHPV